VRCEKRFYGDHVAWERYLCVHGTPGHVALRDVAIPLTRRVLRAGPPRHRHALFDAGAGTSDADVRALLQRAANTPNLTVTLRACRYPHRVRGGKQLPSGRFVAREEPGPWVGAPPKEIRLAETHTVRKGESADQAVRTLVCRELVPGPQPDRWHPLSTSGALEPQAVLQDCRPRQHHEQAYRVAVQDAFLKATPCGCDKEGPDRQRPRFHRGPLQRIGWRLAWVYNALGDLGVPLPDR
jgi:hypothetical protein